jgi:hypothetical protein
MSNVQTLQAQLSENCRIAMRSLRLHAARDRAVAYILSVAPEQFANVISPDQCDAATAFYLNVADTLDRQLDDIERAFDDGEPSYDLFNRLLALNESSAMRRATVEPTLVRID